MLGSLYRWQISSVTSSIHRITGVALGFSFLFVIIWLTGAASGGWWGEFAQFLVTSWLGKLVWLLSLFGVSYHLLNGIRHLFWDLGLGFGLETAKNTGLAVIVGSILLTLFFLLAI